LLRDEHRSRSVGRPSCQGLRQTVTFKPMLIVIDPISAYMPKVDTWRDSDVRSVLAPLAAL
jgi:hypothetical protein